MLMPYKTFVLATLIVCTACSTPPRVAPGGDLGTEPIERDAAVNTESSVTQLPARGPLTGMGVAVSDKRVFLARPRGIWSFTEADPQPRRLVSFPEHRGPLSMVSHQGAVYASVKTDCSDCERYRILHSRGSDGPWIDLPTIEGALSATPPKLFSDGEFLVAEGAEGSLAVFDAAANAWQLLSPEPPADNEHLFTSVFAVQNGAVYANDIYFGGVVRVELQAPEQWQRVDGLQEWGYQGFVTRVGRSVTSSAAGIFTQVDGKWQLTHETASAPHSVIDTGDTFHVFSIKEHLTSRDGVSWTKQADLSSGGWWGATTVANEGRHIAWLFKEGLKVSRDDGASWESINAIVDDYGAVQSAAGAVLFANSPRFTEWHIWNGSEWAGATRFQSAAFTDEGVWSCEVTRCQLWEPTSEQIAREVTMSRGVKPAFATMTADGLWLATSALWDERCKASVSDGVVLMDPETGKVGPASQDLPYKITGYGCRYYWEPTNLMSVRGIVFVSLTNSARDEQRTYRSDDKGTSWELVIDDGLVDIAINASGIYALFASGGAMHSTDHGLRFSAITVPGEGALTAVQASESEVFFSRASWLGDSVWRSTASDEWEALRPASDASFGPVQDLHFADGVLWIASATDGAWKIDFTK